MSGRIFGVAYFSGDSGFLTLNPRSAPAGNYTSVARARLSGDGWIDDRFV